MTSESRVFGLDDPRRRRAERQDAGQRPAEPSQEAYQLLAESLPQLVWTMTPDGCNDYLNSVAGRYFGKEAEVSFGRGWLEVIHPDDRERAVERWNHAMGAGEPYEIEQRLRRADGVFRWFLSRAIPLRDTDGRIMRWFGTNVDIDDQKRAEAQVDALFDAAPIGMTILDTDLRYLRINSALAALNGFPPEEHLGRRLSELMPMLGTVIEGTMRRVIASGEPAMNVAVSVRPDPRPDTLLHLLLNYYPVRVEGQVTGLAAIIVNITDLKKSELQAGLLAQVGAALSSVLEPQQMLRPVPGLVVPGLADWCAVYTLDDSGRIESTAASHIDERKAGLLQEICGRAAFSTDPPHAPMAALGSGASVYVADVGREAGAEAAHLQEMAAAGTTSCMLVPIMIQRRLYGAIGLGMSTPDRRFDRSDLAVAEDLGRRVGVALDNARLFDLAKRERVRAEEAARAKDEFLAVVSHELRTPLNAMLGWTRMLRVGTLDPAKHARALETIERNARAQAQLIEDLLDISRIITGKLRLTVGPVDLPQVVAAATDTIKPAADAKGVQIHTEIERSWTPVSGDPDRLVQVVWNLVSNAVKFTPRGGHVDVRLLGCEDAIEIAVEDTGQGIPASFLPHVFERFQQAEAGPTRSHGGLGLGLAIVRHVVELHGGTIQAHSEGKGRGAKFTVRLPAGPRAMPRASAPQASAQRPVLSPQDFSARPALAGLRVLVVDDELDARELLRSLLEHARVRVDTAKDAEEAFELVKTLRPDVLVSDIGMPGVDGYALMQRIRALPPEAGGKTPAIAITAYARMEDRTRALLAGYTNHLPKPVEPAELLLVLESASGRLRV